MQFSVLLIEDDEADYELTHALLNEAFETDYLLDWVDTTEKALVALKKRQYDLCIVDYQLGPNDGLEFTKLLISSTNRPMPVILLTGQGSREVDLKAMEAGVTDYLVKQDITVTQLERSIRYAIKKKESESKLQNLAHYDVLTGLANRLLFAEKLTDAILNGKRSKENFALLSLDLDRFKLVNDTLGHPAGDKLLVEIAQRIQSCIRDTDTAARLGGDEFAVLLCHGDFGPGAAVVAKKIIDAISQPFMVDDNKLEPGTSVGIAVFPKDGDRSVQLIKKADLALYSAKEDGRGMYRFYDRGLDRFIQHQIDTYKEILESIKDGSFYLCFQPILRLEDNKLVAAEALLRWRRKGLGVGLPDQFIPVAEESRTILPLGQFTIDSACQQLANWQQQGFSDLVMAVNLSSLELVTGEIIISVESALKRHALNPKNLCFEIMESAFFALDNNAAEIVEKLSALGVMICIDSFGKSHGAMSLLQNHPVTKIKIERQLLADASQDKKAQAYYQAFTLFAESMEVDVVAVGVESEQQVEMLKTMGVAEYQGYYIGQPMTPEAFFEQYGGQ